MTRLVRGTGWALLTGGVVVVLYAVYLTWFTGLETAQAQRDLGGAFEAMVTADVDGADAEVADAEPTPQPVAMPEDVEPGEPVAALWFERDGERIVNDDVLYVVSGVTMADLRHGPGHYPDSPAPGADGNVGIAGHRSTYGSPFWSLDELTDGDTIHVRDREGTEWVYAYREQQVVAPTDTWVIDETDPLELDAPTLTLTTCHPRTSNRQRLVAWGELLGPAEQLT